MYEELSHGMGLGGERRQVLGKYLHSYKKDKTKRNNVIPVTPAEIAWLNA